MKYRLVGRPQSLCERVRRRFHYDAATGDLIYRYRCGPVGAGEIAGTLGPMGYIAIQVDGTIYRAHHLVWLHVTGKLPTLDLDHIDGNKANNRFGNLREATKVENMQNLRRPKKNNKSGYLGVNSLGGSWVATINVPNPSGSGRGKKLHLGCFKSPEEAHAAYLEAKRQLHSHCTL